MKPGKISNTILDRSVFKLIRKRGNIITEKPGIGKDCGKIPCNGKDMLVSTQTGEYAVYSVANNIFSSGGKIIGVNVAITMPEAMREIRLKEVVAELEKQCTKLGIPIIGGHTCCSKNVVKPIVAVTGFGYKEKELSGIRPGQDIVYTKWVGISGIKRIIDAKKEEILKLYSEDVINKAYGSDSDLIIDKENDLVLSENLSIGTMHDVSTGGIFAALWDMAEAGRVGIEIDLKAISMKQEIIEICEIFNINPYELESIGGLLMTSDDGYGIVNRMEQIGVKASVIGKVTEGNQKKIIGIEEERFLELPKVDEIYKVIE